jgi:hypothetical protein
MPPPSEPNGMRARLGVGILVDHAAAGVEEGRARRAAVDEAASASEGRRHRIGGERRDSEERGRERGEQRTHR